MNTITMKNKTNHDFDMTIVDWERPLVPEMNDEYRQITGKDGEQHDEERLSNQVIRVEFFRKNENIEEWFESRNEIVEWLFTRDEIEIRLDDEPDVYYIGKVTSADVPTYYRTAIRFWVEFTCHPVKYGQDVTTTETVFTYNGTYDKTPFKLTLENVTTNELVVSVNGVEIKYTEPLENATVTIDSNELELRVDGTLKVFEVEGYFTFLKPGEIEIDINTDADLTIEYTELFL